MKYRNKDTGVIVEAMQITLKDGIAQDILDFGNGLICSIEKQGFSPNEVYVFILKLTARAVPFADTYIVKAGDYLIKNEESMLYLHEEEFKKHFELVKEENDMNKLHCWHCDVDVEISDNRINYCPVCGAYVGKKRNKETDERTITKDIFDPIDNAASTLKTHERTVRDCILDMIIEEKALKIQELMEKYFTHEIGDCNNSIESGYHSKEDEEKLLEKCKQYMESRALLRCPVSEFLQLKEEDLRKATHTGYNELNYAIECIEKRMNNVKESEA